MVKLLLSTLTAIAVILSVVKCDIAPTQTFPYQASLIDNDVLNLYWAYDNDAITFELHSKNQMQPPLSTDFMAKNPGVVRSNTSWIMFGFRAVGAELDALLKADLVVAWMNQDGTGHLSDRVVKPNGKRAVTDAQTNTFPIDAFIKDGFTVVKFKRMIDICIEMNSEDITLGQGPLELLYKVDYLYKNGDYFIEGESDPALQGDITSLLSSKKVELMKPDGRPYVCPLVVEPKFGMEPMGVYSYMAELIPMQYRFYWNFTDTELIGEIVVKTKGWVSFGLSQNGGMPGSDVFVAWINDVDGTVNFTDRHIVDRKVLIDQKQEWFVLATKQVNDFTLIKFKRSIISCDTEDLKIQQGSPYVIYAYGLADPAPGADISYHQTNRGSKVLNLISAPKSTAVNEPNLEVISFTLNNVILPKKRTYYYVKGFQVPKTLTQKRHIVKWELMLPKYNFDKMHHALVYECQPDFEGVVENAPGEIDYELLKGQHCMMMSIGWAVGGDLTRVYPADTGYPIGGDTDYKYFILELHYDNPNSDLGYIDGITLKFFTTKNLRKNELGILVVGAAASPNGIFIPPGTASFPIKVYCNKDCTDKKITTDLTIIQSLPHTHLTGIAVSTKLIRNGVNTNYVTNIPNYDFNYQQGYDLNPPLALKKGDELMTTCVYQTSKKTTYTLGGESTYNEMCMDFLIYYPRLPSFKSCMSIPSQPALYKMLQEFTKTGQVNLTDVPATTPFGDYFSILYKDIKALDPTKVDDAMRNRFIEFMNTTKYYQVCGMDFDQTERSPIQVTKEYVEQDACQSTPPQTFVGKVVAFIKNVFNTLFGWLFKL